MTNPPSWTSGAHTLARKAVACTSTSSPRPPVFGFSWHSPQLVELKSGPSPVSGLKVRSKTAFPRAKRSRCSRVSPRSGSPGRPGSLRLPLRDSLGDQPGVGQPAIGPHHVAGLELADMKGDAPAGDDRLLGGADVNEPERVPDAGDEVERAGLHFVHGAAVRVGFLRLCSGERHRQQTDGGDCRRRDQGALHAAY